MVGNHFLRLWGSHFCLPSSRSCNSSVSFLAVFGFSYFCKLRKVLKTPSHSTTKTFRNFLWIWVTFFLTVVSFMFTGCHPSLTELKKDWKLHSRKHSHLTQFPIVLPVLRSRLLLEQRSLHYRSEWNKMGSEFKKLTCIPRVHERYT